MWGFVATSFRCLNPTLLGLSMMKRLLKHTVLSFYYNNKLKGQHVGFSLENVILLHGTSKYRPGPDFDLILYVLSTIFQLNRDGSSWVEPVLS